MLNVLKKFSLDESVPFRDLSMIALKNVILEDEKGMKFKVKSVLPIRLVVTLQEDFLGYKKGDEVVGRLYCFNGSEIITLIIEEKHGS